ncbi:MAG: hypothetical protein C0412_11610, partial [Flavobacterium sp.]|nr:hypothetical protein [Flavobacterium sp.]
MYLCRNLTFEGGNTMSARKIDDPKYITDLFGNLSEQSEIPVSVYHQNQHILGTMSFSYRKKSGLNVYINLKEQVISNGSELEIMFFYEDIFFSFKTFVIENKGEVYIVEKPSTVFKSFKRVITRHKIHETEEFFICFPQNKTPLKPSDISTKGVSFVSEDKFLFEGQIVRNIKIKMPEQDYIYTDGEVKHCKKSVTGTYIYGVFFTEKDFNLYNKLFDYIFRKTYTNLKNLNEFSIEEIISLYDASKQLDLQTKNNIEDLNFMRKVEHLHGLRNRQTIFSGVVQYKEDKLLNVGSMLRLYSNTFLGQQLLSASENKTNPKARAYIRSGLADIMLNHPYFKYCLVYVDGDYSAVSLFKSVADFVNDKDKFLVDELEMYECEIGTCEEVNYYEDYSTMGLDDCKDFVGYCEANLSFLEKACYDYDSQKFELGEMKEIYESLGLFVARKLLGIYKNGKLVAYAVVEAFADGIRADNFNDICRVYFVGEGVDVGVVITALLPDLKGFYERYGKERFGICFKGGGVVSIDGVRRRSLVSRVIMDYEGLSQFKKVLTSNFKYWSKYYPLSHPQKAIWYMEKVYPDTSMGNVAGTLKINGEVDYFLLEVAINTVLEKNDILRMRIVE